MVQSPFNIPLLFCFKIAIIVFVIYIILFAEYGKYPFEIKVFKRKRRRFGKRERICRNMLQFAFGKNFPSVRPNFLKSPLTGKNLELDCYCEELNLAIEVQGRQHYKHVPFFHKSYKDFVNQKQRDRIKKDLCRIRGIDLIEVPYWIKTSNVPTYLVNELKRIGRL